MPQPTLPPTPASSTELLAKDLSRSSLDNAFALPPPALQDSAEDGSRSTATSSSNPSLMSSPEQRSRPRRASTTKAAPKQPLELPPPPSRSRKIIQMKPKTPQQPQSVDNTANTNNKNKSEPAPLAGTKRKAAGTSAAAGRKIARKTAHSLIERRRRSKMNEEFATLKDMVPACRGHEMHKLAILQASIDYLRYLQDCITDLKAAAGNGQPMPPPMEVQTSPTFSPISSTAMSTPYLSPALEAQNSGSQMSTPKMTAQDNKVDMLMHRPTSWTSRRDTAESIESQAGATITNKQEGEFDPDQNEATAALLMLNRDRRELGQSAKSPGGNEPSGTLQQQQQLPPPLLKPRTSIGGMSVRELLS